MFLLRRYSRFVALPLAALMMAVSMPLGAAQAALMDTDQVIDRSAVEVDRARIAALFARDDVRQELQALGVDPDEANARIAGMTDQEVREVAARIDTLPAGQGVAEALISAALIIFIVLLVTDLLGVTDVFPFVKGGKAQ
ncbi:MAG: PA2779 family protein [Rhodospirillales bacterium]|nr:MAG: PA2779 family protein [Rhodospirillales bacterium]